MVRNFALWAPPSTPEASRGCGGPGQERRDCGRSNWPTIAVVVLLGLVAGLALAARPAAVCAGEVALALADDAARAADPAESRLPTDASPEEPTPEEPLAPAEAPDLPPATEPPPAAAEQPPEGPPPTGEAGAEAEAATVAETPAEEVAGDWRSQAWVTFLVAALVVVLPFVLGSTLSKRWRMPDYFGKIVIVSFCVLASVAVTVMGWPPKLGIDLRGGVILVYELAEEEDEGLREVARTEPDEEADQRPATDQADIDMDKLIAAISRRVNPGGVKEVTIRQAGPEQIEVIVPEVDEAEVNRLKDVISSVGTLEFRILANDRDHASIIKRAEADETRVRLFDEENNLLAWWVPVADGKEESFAGYDEIATRTRERQGRETLEILVVKDRFNVNGGYLVRATPSTDQNLRPSVNFTFNARGGQLFRGLTSNNLPDEVQQFSRKLGIILDGYLHSAPAIRSTIGEHGEITGDFTQEEVEDLVSVLNAGSLPTALKEEPISQLVTGPQLGSDTIAKGQIAIAVSVSVVLLFMLFYYRFAGIVACMAMVLNLFLILAVMITIKAAFTLPGIAGLVLTVGMAVDANVLIFERIREELEKNAALRMAIRNGFGRATSAIVDANLTTLITATVLYVVGTDQVKGFAVTLWLGVVMSMFTAIYCSRVVFDIAEKQKWVTRLSMLQILRHPQIDFLGKRRAFAVVSLAVIIVGLVGVFVRGKGILDIDFTGGVSVQAVFDEPQDIAEVRAKLSDLRDLAVSDVALAGEEPNRRFMINTSSRPDVDPTKYLDEVEQKITKAFPQALTHFTVDVTIEPAAGAEATSARQPAAPPAEAQSRRDLPPASLLAAVGPEAVLLAQAEPAEGSDPPEPAPEETPEEPPAELETPSETSGREPPESSPAESEPTPPVPGPENSEEENPSEEPGADEASVPAEDETPAEMAGEQIERSPAAEPAEPSHDAAPEAEPAEPDEEPAVPQAAPPTEEPAAGTGRGQPEVTVAMLNFGEHRIEHDAVLEMFETQIETGSIVPPSTQVSVSSPAPGYYEGDSRSYSRWKATIQLPPEQARALVNAVEEKFESQPYFPSSNTIGGKVAGSTRVQAIAALLASLVFIVGYIWIRFQRVMYGLAAVVALVHDVLITLGMIALSAFVAGFLGFLLISEFKIGLPVLAAFLTIIGYSLNDTIVVFDRIREVRGKAPQLTEGMINSSINQTLSRTLLTSFTTLIVVLILYIGGGQGIHAFAFSLVIGVIVGTYSSIFVASPVLLWMSRPPAPRKAA